MDERTWSEVRTQLRECLGRRGKGDPDTALEAEIRRRLSIPASASLIDDLVAFACRSLEPGDYLCVAQPLASAGYVEAIERIARRRPPVEGWSQKSPVFGLTEMLEEDEAQQAQVVRALESVCRKGEFLYHRVDAFKQLRRKRKVLAASTHQLRDGIVADLKGRPLFAHVDHALATPDPVEDRTPDWFCERVPDLLPLATGAEVAVILAAYVGVERWSGKPLPRLHTWVNDLTRSKDEVVRLGAQFVRDARGWATATQVLTHVRDCCSKGSKERVMAMLSELA